MEKIITLFNHKGGVSKTTTTFNIAWKLADMGKKVLLVDADPQCNLTGIFLGKNFDGYYEGSTSKMNLKDAVDVAFSGRPQPIAAIECPHHVRNENLFIIPGHMDLASYEGTLSLAWNSYNAIVTLQNLPGAFYELIRQCSVQYDIDYVLIDMNPGLSSINQTCFVYSDAFIVPTNPDPFAVMAMKTLKKTLPRWKTMALRAKELFTETSYPLPDKGMKFIGAIIQEFSMRNKQPAGPFRAKIADIKEYANTEFSQAMKKYEMLCDIGLEDRCLAEIPDFDSLIQKANVAMTTVFSLTKDDIAETGVVLKNAENKSKYIDGIFNKLATVVMKAVQ